MVHKEIYKFRMVADLLTLMDLPDVWEVCVMVKQLQDSFLQGGNRAKLFYSSYI